MIYYGVVEDRVSDPLKLGRCKVRIVGLHSEDNKVLPAKELPWAMVMQPTTSSANSGIGHSPTGIVEGTWVMVVFRDEYNQFPVIIGTLPGIPTLEKTKPSADSSRSTQKTKPNVVVSGDGTAVTDGSGQPITSGGQEIAGKKEDPEKEPSANAAKRPTAMTVSQAGLDFLGKEEGLASLSQTKRQVSRNPATLSDNTPLFPYLDTKGIWTIGWGFIFLRDGSRVTENSRMTKGEADLLKKDMLSGKVKIPDFPAFEPWIRKRITAPLTQSMYDACVSMVYNMGISFTNTPIVKSLNAGKYEEAASLITVTRTSGGLQGRRNREKELFLKDGIPQDDGTLKEVPVETERVVDATQNPVVRKDEKFAQDTVDPGNVKQLNEGGFVDPNKKFPRFFDEPDVNRLARNEMVDGTIVFKKECSVAKGIPTANGGSWSQPPIPYNARYPYNMVYVSESGHVQEFDDTPENERIHTYHKSGTFSEIDVNGTRVNRIVGDSFEILERDGNVIVRGNCNITVVGDGNIRIENNATIEALGNMDIKVGGDIGIGAGGNIRMSAGGEVSMDGSNVHMNSGKGGGVKKAFGGASGGVSFAPLRTPTRFDDIGASYETPEEGAPPEEYEQKKVEIGVSDPDEPPVALDEKEDVQIEEKKEATGIPSSCDLIFKEKSFDWSYRLSENFTLKDVLRGSKPELPNGTCYGVSANQIVCNLKQLTVNVLEPIKKRFPNMVITNTWRSERRNGEVGGSKTSKHMTGQAVDIVLSGFSKKQLFDACVEMAKLLKSYDKILLEYSGNSMWIHIQYLQTGNQNICGTIVVKPYKYHSGFKFFE
jgi:GH24 family phage-related lysozyme (muramidase)